MKVTRGARVNAGQEIGEVWSPQLDDTVATYMRALAEVNARSAELRIKARAARESLEASRSYLRVTEEATQPSRHVNDRKPDVSHRDAAGTRTGSKTVVAQEAEIEEASVQLASLDEFGEPAPSTSRWSGAQFRRWQDCGADRRDRLECSCARRAVGGGGHAHRRDPEFERCVRQSGTSPMSASPIRRWEGRLSSCSGEGAWKERSPRSCPFPISTAGRNRQSFVTPIATQIARVRFGPNAVPPALKSTVYVQHVLHRFRRQRR